MDTLTFLREQIRAAHEYLEGTMADVRPEHVQWMPPGKANPLGATYAHVVMAEDGVVNGMLKGGLPLGAGPWAGRTGLSEPMPAPGPDWQHYPAWTRTVTLDLAALRQYAQAVYAATDEFLASLKPEDLERPIDFSAVGLGTQSLGWILGRAVLGHIDNMCGEISALKGVQGVRGYPE